MNTYPWFFSPFLKMLYTIYKEKSKKIIEKTSLTLSTFLSSNWSVEGRLWCWYRKGILETIFTYSMKDVIKKGRVKTKIFFSPTPALKRNLEIFLP